MFGENKLLFNSIFSGFLQQCQKGPALQPHTFVWRVGPSGVYEASLSAEVVFFYIQENHDPSSAQTELLLPVIYQLQEKCFHVEHFIKNAKSLLFKHGNLINCQVYLLTSLYCLLKHIKSSTLHQVYFCSEVFFKENFTGAKQTQ